MRIPAQQQAAMAITVVVAASVIVSSLAGCAPAPAGNVPASLVATAPASANVTERDRPMGWRAESHSDEVDPNYAIVFPADAVKTFTITFSPEAWQAMQDDLNTNLAKGGNIADYSPIWVPATITFDGVTWTNVGVRHKGQSSLEKAWREGAQNLPFKVDFDKFEDDHPEIKNQRFFGFNELSLANNTNDPTAMRDTLVYDILARAGLPAMHTAAYEVILDHGDGATSLGLYTATEVVDDTGVAAFFSGEKGNIYEATGPSGVSLAEGTFDQIPVGFEKKNNEDSSYADLERLYTVLHDARRTTEPQAWRTELESVFNVDGFLEWLGIATAVAHLDTYGVAGHNFYIYNDPATGKLNWISWDHNETFQVAFAALLPFDRAIVGESWVLIRFLLDDPVYYARYVALLEENSRTVLEPDALTRQVRARAALLAPYATTQLSPAEYDAAVGDLVGFIESRGTELRAFLDQK